MDERLREFGFDDDELAEMTEEEKAAELRSCEATWAVLKDARPDPANPAGEWIR